jgi:tetratricopeptide (TPR) repeat protein
VAYDTGLHGHAERYLTLALSFARHAEDDGLGAEILAAKAHQAVYLGRPAEAVDMARAAQATARRAGLPTLLAECCVMEAHGHAAANDARACAQALSDAESAFDRSARHSDPRWLRYFDEAYLAARMAHCFRDLGEPRHAERYARRSLDMDGRFVRGKAFNLSLLATALAEQGDAEQACAVGARAVDVTAGLRSARSVRYIRNLQRALRGAADAPVVREFTAQVEQRLPEHQRVLHADDRGGPGDAPVSDHRGGVIQRNPADLGGLVSLRLPHQVGTARQVEVLRKICVADHRLERQHESGRPRTPAGLLLGLSDRCSWAVLAIVNVTARQLPNPSVDDEPMTAQQQNLRPRFVQDRDHGAAPEPEHILGELIAIRQLDISEADADMRILVYQPLAVNDPAIPAIYGFSRHSQRR